MVPKNKYLFVIEDVPENQKSIIGDTSFTVTINTVECWKRYHLLTYSYTKEQMDEIEPVLTELGLCELMESIYQPSKIKDKDKMREALLAKGFEENQEFSEFIKKHEN